MVKKGELTDEAWARIAPLLRENGRRGGRWRDHREVVNGILWKLRTGAPWRGLPERYGPWQTCYDRFSRWRRDGTWDRLLADAQTKSDPVGEVEWLVSVDSTIARAHQHVAGARRRPSKEDVKKGLASRGRGDRAKPRRADDQAALGLRRQGPAAVGGLDRGPAPREHPA